MISIRQLGLKAYIDFPGAIHTRYSHVLGAMNLAGRVVDILQEIQNDAGKTVIGENLRESRTELVAAGFLHDIAHGPFSHAVDYALEVIAGSSHEDLATKMIKENLPADFFHWVDIEKVIGIIQKKYDYQFISEIINGPLDVDKLDYLLRDAHHVGLKYSFDLDNFLSHYTVIGEESDLTRCNLGLENSLQARVTAELFLVIWKSMYDLVYHAENSRIAEKMLEKAILISKSDNRIQRAFGDEYLTLDDDKLLEILRAIGSKPEELVKRILSNQLYSLEIDEELDAKKFEVTGEFIADIALPRKSSRVSEELTIKLNEKLGLPQYQLICDIVTSRSPQDILIATNDTHDDNTLRGHSKIVSALKAESHVKVYQDRSSTKITKKDEIDTILREIVEREIES